MKKVLISLLLLIIAAYLVWAVASLSRRPTGVICSDIELVIRDTLGASFISRQEVLSILSQSGMSPVGLPIDSVRTTVIEQALASHGLVDHVECYKTPSGLLRVEVYQRIPILRVMSDVGESYFIDNKGAVMPQHVHCAAHLAVATGKIEKSFAVNNLYQFALFLQRNAFWRANVEQINVLKNGDVEIVPRVGDHIIFLGPLDGYEGKLDRVRRFYEEGLNHVGWNKYAVINVELPNQIVCTKKRP